MLNGIGKLAALVVLAGIGMVLGVVLYPGAQWGPGETALLSAGGAVIAVGLVMLGLSVSRGTS